MNRRRSRRPPGQTATATADAAGHFELEAPSGGGWALVARARGYTAQALDEHEGFSTAVVLTDASPKAEITFRLTPASAIEGYIYDEAGDAVRDAQVVLSFLPPALPDDARPKPQTRDQVQTDDRGFYKFSGKEPGSYQIRVTAHPWYATSSAGQRPVLRDTDSEDDPTSQGPDPLDVVYPTVWYPGATDPSAAVTITLHGGETAEANLRLLAVPGIHLRIEDPAASARNQTGVGTAAQPLDGQLRIGPQSFVYVTRLQPDGTEEPQQYFNRLDSNGVTDIAGLAPGSYVVHQQNPTTDKTTVSTVKIGSNSARTIDLTQGVPATTVSVQVDPPLANDSAQIIFRDLETGRVNFAQREEDPGQRSRGRRQLDASQPQNPDQNVERTVALTPGKYEVTMNGQGDTHLAGIEATGATAVGRTVTIAGGSPRLVLHTANGRGLVTGFVTFHGHPDPGAMVLLIPATLGDPAGIDLPARDQSNSDGSFEMSGVLPGGYILVAIDHGWDVNWSDPSTLRRYLMHGTALDIKPSADLKEHIEALAP